MDALFVIAAVGAGAAYAWLPLRDALCARRGHQVGPPCLRMTHEDGSYETECVCMCRQKAVITLTRAFAATKEATWGARASGTTPAPSP